MEEFLYSNIKEIIPDLKEINTLLTEIKKTTDALSKSDLDTLASEAFHTAGRYGKKAADYLSAYKEAAYDGFPDAGGIAELSLAAQSAGNITAELAGQFINATDKAFRLGGSVSRLKEILDGASAISSHNAINMTDLAEGMSLAGEYAAALGLGADEAAAALASIISATGQDGSEAAQTLKSILLNIQQITDAEPGNLLNADLLGSLDSPQGSDALNGFLGNYSMYESMLQDYAKGAGSMAAQAEISASSWEGAMNRLSNTWTDTVGNVANPNAMLTIINSLNGILSVVNKLTKELGSLGTVGLGAGLLASFKNVGRDKTYSLFWS